MQIHLKYVSLVKLLQILEPDLIKQQTKTYTLNFHTLSETSVDLSNQNELKIPFV
jgi:hypothetical protein